MHAPSVGDRDGVSCYRMVNRSLEFPGTLALTAPRAEELAGGREDAHVVA